MDQNQVKLDAQQKAEAEEVRVGWRMAGIGMQVASEVAAGVILGLLFDYWRGKGNIGVIIGASAGILVALWNLVRSTLKLNRQLDASASTKGRGRTLAAEQEWNQEKAEDDDWNADKDRDDWAEPKRQR